MDTSSVSMLNEAEILLEKGKNARDDRGMRVEGMNVARTNACIFCSKTVTQISKYLQSIHKNKENIKKICLPKGDPENKTAGNIKKKKVTKPLTETRVLIRA